MAENTAADDRTEAATPRRVQRARDEGHVAVSRELAILGGLAGAILALNWFGRDAAIGLSASLAEIVAHSGTASLSDGRAVFMALALILVKAVAPFVLATLIGSVTMILLQTGFLMRAAALIPDLSRVNPITGLQRLFSVEHGIDALKSIAKIFAIALAIIIALSGDMSQLRNLMTQSPSNLLVLSGILAGHILTAALLVQAVIAGGDLLWVRLRHARNLRMSRQEIREELREAEGDPKIRARIRQIRMQRARRRMLAAVPKATVIVTNPTHYAVALAYNRGGTAAPRVVAKGVDSMARRIREMAMAHGVPLVANPPLARALYAVKLDDDIPAEYYKAVAEIIAYVWRLSRRTVTLG